MMAVLMALTLVVYVFIARSFRYKQVRGLKHWVKTTSETKSISSVGHRPSIEW